jgi:hypothetical protein
MLRDAPLSDCFPRPPRLADRAAPAAICCFLDLAGIFSHSEDGTAGQRGVSLGVGDEQCLSVGKDLPWDDKFVVAIPEGSANVSAEGSSNVSANLSKHLQFQGMVNPQVNSFQWRF